MYTVEWRAAGLPVVSADWVVGGSRCLTCVSVNNSNDKWTSVKSLLICELKVKKDKMSPAESRAQRNTKLHRINTVWINIQPHPGPTGAGFIHPPPPPCLWTAHRTRSGLFQRDRFGYVSCFSPDPRSDWSLLNQLVWSQFAVVQAPSWRRDNVEKNILRKRLFEMIRIIIVIMITMMKRGGKFGLMILHKDPPLQQRLIQNHLKKKWLSCSGPWSSFGLIFNTWLVNFFFLQPSLVSPLSPIHNQYQLTSTLTVNGFLVRRRCRRRLRPDSSEHRDR